MIANFTLHKKRSFPLRISSVNVTKSAGNSDIFRKCFRCFNSGTRNKHRKHTSRKFIMCPIAAKLNVVMKIQTSMK